LKEIVVVATISMAAAIAILNPEFKKPFRARRAGPHAYFHRMDFAHHWRSSWATKGIRLIRLGPHGGMPGSG
jgi:hypothetical protein